LGFEEIVWVAVFDFYIFSSLHNFNFDMDKIKNFLGIGKDSTPRLFALYSCPISSPAKITVVYYILDQPTRTEVEMQVKNFLEPDAATGTFLIKSKLFSKRDHDIPTLHVYQANLPLVANLPYLLDFVI
jgi:hypothetical protein